MNDLQHVVLVWCRHRGGTVVTTGVAQQKCSGFSSLLGSFKTVIVGRLMNKWKIHNSHLHASFASMTQKPLTRPMSYRT